MMDPDCLLQPPVSIQIGYCNIGLNNWMLQSEDHALYRKEVGRECAHAFESGDLSMLNLVEFGDNYLNENPDAHLGNSAGFQDRYLGQSVNQWLVEAIRECCTTSIDIEAYILGPYAIVLNKNVCCFATGPTLTGPLLESPNTDHAYRRAVHSEVKVLPNGPLIEVWVHHAPSSQERPYTLLTREQTMYYFFEKVSNNGIVGGDLNMSKHGVKNALSTWSSQTGLTHEEIDQRRKAWRTHVLSEAKHGDLALTRGLPASQIEMPQRVKSKYATTKTHDVVVVQIDLADLPPAPWPEPSSDVRESSAAQPAPRAHARARKFLAALEDEAHERGDHPQQAALLRELVNTLWGGYLVKEKQEDLDEDQQEDLAIAKLDELIELVVAIRKAWITSGESSAIKACNVKERRLRDLEGDMSEGELISCHNFYMNSLVWMNPAKRKQYYQLKREQQESKGKGKSKSKLDTKGKSKGKSMGKLDKRAKLGPGQEAQQLKKGAFNTFLFQASGSKQFLLALVRRPSFLKAKGVQNLLEEWTKIKKSDDYTKAVEQSKKRTDAQDKAKAELQYLRIRINRLRRESKDTKHLLQRLRAKEANYGRGKQDRPPGASLASAVA